MDDETWYFESLPRIAFHCVSKSFSVIGVPSDHFAFGLISIVTVCPSPDGAAFADVT